MKTLGTALRAFRRGAACSQGRLAEMLGVSQPTVSGWENGHHDVSRRDLVAILSILDIPETEWPEVMRLPVQVDDEQLEGAA